MRQDIKRMHTQIEAFNQTTAPYTDNKTLHQLFQEQVERIPEHTAVIFNNEKWTFRQLNRKVNRLAHLLRQKGVGPNQVVGIMVERSMEMITGILGILKAGGAYLPIEPAYPVNRTRMMLEDSQAGILLTQFKFLDRVPDKIESIDLKDPAIENQGEANLDVVNESTDPAYVIFTSGSTGQPKGVLIEHRSVVNRLHWMQKKYPLEEADLILQKTPFVFDVSVWELFWWSMVGAGVCFLPPGLERFPQAIVEAVETQRVSVIHFVPSMMSVFLEYVSGAGDIERLSSLRQVFVSGEILKPSCARLFHDTMYRHNRTRLTNLYGPTEATVDVTYFDCNTGDEAGTIPIGKPIDNTQCWLVDPDENLQPVGESGELCISGHGVARGYLNRVELTREKFVHCPFVSPQSPGEDRMYKTGDRGHWLADGNIVFEGRIDNQVKIRGLRIELEEIEAVLSSHESITDCVVVAREKTSTIITLVAFIVPAGEARPDIQQLKKYLRSLLPDYMIPAEFIYLDQFPLTINGKVDRRLLIEKYLP